MRPPDIGLPRTLRDVEVDEKLIPAMAESAFHNDLNHTTNSRPITVAGMAALYARVHPKKVARPRTEM